MGKAWTPRICPSRPGLVTRIRAWQETYEASDPDDSPDFDWTAFDAEGWSIARDVKAALPDWTVIYFDEARRRRGARTCQVEIGSAMATSVPSRRA